MDRPSDSRQALVHGNSRKHAFHLVTFAFAGDSRRLPTASEALSRLKRSVRLTVP